MEFSSLRRLLAVSAIVGLVAVVASCSQSSDIDPVRRPSTPVSGLPDYNRELPTALARNRILGSANVGDPESSAKEWLNALIFKDKDKVNVLTIKDFEKAEIKTPDMGYLTNTLARLSPSGGDTYYTLRNWKFETASKDGTTARVRVSGTFVVGYKAPGTSTTIRQEPRDIDCIMKMQLEDNIWKFAGDAPSAFVR